MDAISADTIQSSTVPQHVRHALEHMRTNLREKITLEDLAAFLSAPAAAVKDYGPLPGLAGDISVVRNGDRPLAGRAYLLWRSPPD